MTSKYGKTQGRFKCSFDEGELTSIKSRMVKKSTLARRMDEMGFAEHLYMGQGDISYTSTWWIQFDGISQWIPPTYDYLRIKYHCELKLLDNLPIYRGFGASKSEARMNVCKLAYEDLTKKGVIQVTTIRDEIKNPNKADAISQLEILARRGYFSIPTYDFKEKHDENGNPVWAARCFIKEYESFFEAVSSSKKEAKKQAAYEMLLFVMNEEDD